MSSTESIPSGLVLKNLPKTSYAVFTAIGEHPKALIETWENIWNSNLKRTYSGDFELYEENFLLKDIQKVEVYIAIEE